MAVRKCFDPGARLCPALRGQPQQLGRNLRVQIPSQLLSSIFHARLRPPPIARPVRTSSQMFFYYKIFFKLKGLT